MKLHQPAFKVTLYYGVRKQHRREFDNKFSFNSFLRELRRQKIVYSYFFGAFPVISYNSIITEKV